MAPLHGVTEAAPPLVAAPRFELPKVTGAASLLPDAAPHRPLPPLLPAHSTPSSRTTRAAQPAALPPPTPAPSPSQEFPRAGESPYFADQELDLAQFLTPAADTEAGYDDVPAGEPTPEAPAIAPEPVEQPSGDGLAGIIAMLDAEVARTRSDDGPAFPPADEDEATEKIYRPSLAESRRRGFAVGTGPAPTEGAGPAASPEPASAGEAEPTPAEPSAGTDVRGGEPRPVEASLVTGRSVTRDGDEETAADGSSDSETPSASGLPIQIGGERPLGPVVDSRFDSQPPQRPVQQPSIAESAVSSSVASSAAVSPPVTAPVSPPLTSSMGSEMPALEATTPAAREPATDAAIGDGVLQTPTAPPSGTTPTAPADEPTSDESIGTLSIQQDEPPSEAIRAEAYARGDPAASALSDAYRGADPHAAQGAPAHGASPDQDGDLALAAELARARARGHADTSLPGHLTDPDIELRATGTGAAGPGSTGIDRSPAGPPSPPATSPAATPVSNPAANPAGSPATKPASATTVDTGGHHDDPARRIPNSASDALAPHEPPSHTRPTSSQHEHPFREPVPVTRPPEAVPSATVARFEGLTGIDLGFVPINRAPSARRTASEIGARAFTSQGTIHLPDDLGALDRHDNESLIAHELMHVAQERQAAGSTEPFDAQAWEDQAAMVERAFRGEPVPDNWNAEFAPFPDVSARSWAPDSGFVQGVPSMPELVQRAPLFEQLPMPDFPPPAPPPPEVTELVDSGQGHDLVYGDVPSELLRDQPPPRQDSDTEPSYWLDDDVIDSLVARVRDTLVIPDFDVDDPLMLERLADNLYGRVRGHLRQELLVDRERSGVLTEFQEE